MAERAPSKRKSTPRTKHGCSTCRRRRIKCCEQRPSCQNCIRSGWTCPGYDETILKTGPSLGDILIRSYALPYKVPGSQEERRALHYFTISAAEDIWGYFSADFWTRSILQRCQHSAPVRHAVVALSCLHWEYIVSSVQDTFTASAHTVSAYTKSMTSLRRYAMLCTAPDLMVVLMCCAAFFCFELIRGEQGAALRHLQGGVNVLQQWRKDSLASSSAKAQEDDRRKLTDVFTRLNLQASAFDDGKVPMLKQSHQTLEKQSNESESEMQSVKYSTLLRRCFNFLVECAPWRASAVEEIPPETLVARDGLLIEINGWDEHLDALEAQSKDQQTARQLDRAIARSRVHSTAVQILTNRCLPSCESHPTLDDKADEILHLARAAIGIHSSDLSSAEDEESGEDGWSARRHFSIQLGVIARVFLLALDTRRGEILASCLKFLRACKGRREAFFDADTTRRILDTLIDQQDAAVKGSILEKMGNDATTCIRQAVQKVAPASDEAGKTMRAVLPLLAIVA